jgi:tetratricopeptide (TPR) repeat protein
LVVIPVWGIAAVVERSRIARGIAVGAAAAALIVLIALTQHQLNYWQGGTMTLCQHALDVDPDNAIAQYEIGYVLSQRGQADAAMAHVLRARELAPRYAKIHYLLGHLLRERGRLDDAVAAYRASLALDPKFPLAWQELGATQELTGDRVAAANSLAKALELNPDSFYVKQRLSRLRAAPTARAD